MNFQSRHTRFRAYQLISKGSSFSYWDGVNFTLGEARFNNENKASIFHELKKCGKSTIDTLYISSWEDDHCKPEDLQVILKYLKPTTIYFPWAKPDSAKNGQVQSKKIIDEYQGPPLPRKVNGKNLPPSLSWNYADTFFPLSEQEKSNDNSLIVLFHTGNIGVFSVGDVESGYHATTLSKVQQLKQEVDIFILSHHGSSRDFNTEELIKTLNPRVCIALVDRDNQYGHPDPIVRQRANNLSYYFSTKDGDVIVEANSDNNHSTFTLYNYISNGEKLEDKKSFESKRGKQNRLQVWKF